MSFDLLLILAFAGSIVMMILVALRRMGWLGRRSGRKVTSGVANWLADINEMLQPQLPRAEVIERLREEGEEDEDEGEGDPPS